MELYWRKDRQELPRSEVLVLSFIRLLLRHAAVAGVFTRDGTNGATALTVGTVSCSPGRWDGQRVAAISKVSMNTTIV